MKNLNELKNIFEWKCYYYGFECIVLRFYLGDNVIWFINIWILVSIKDGCYFIWYSWIYYLKFLIS